MWQSQGTWRMTEQPPQWAFFENQQVHSCTQELWDQTTGQGESGGARAEGAATQGCQLWVAGLGVCMPSLSWIVRVVRTISLPVCISTCVCAYMYICILIAF